MLRLANIAMLGLFIWAIGQALIMHGVALTGRDAFYYGSTSFCVVVLVCNIFALLRR